MFEKINIKKKKNENECVETSQSDGHTRKLFRFSRQQPEFIDLDFCCYTHTHTDLHTSCHVI